MAEPDWPQIECANTSNSQLCDGSGRVLARFERRTEWSYSADRCDDVVVAHRVTNCAADCGANCMRYLHALAFAMDGALLWEARLHGHFLGCSVGCFWTFDSEPNICRTYSAATGAHVASIHIDANEAGELASCWPFVIARGPRAGCVLDVGDEGVHLYERAAPLWAAPGVDGRVACFLTDDAQHVCVQGVPLRYYDVVTGAMTTWTLEGLPVEPPAEWVLVCAYSRTRVLAYVTRLTGDRGETCGTLELHDAARGVVASATEWTYAPDRVETDYGLAGHTLLLWGGTACLMENQTARIVKEYAPFCSMAWQRPLPRCARVELDAAVEAVAAIDALADEELGAVAEAVGLVRAVLVAFVAEDARLTATRLAAQRAF